MHRQTRGKGAAADVKIAGASLGQQMPVHGAFVNPAEATRQGLGESGLLEAAVKMQGVQDVLQTAAQSVHAAPLLGGGRVFAGI